MIKRFPEYPVDGVLLLDKPEGISSNFALQKAKRLYQAIKAGHAGTLDPMATGMLPICFGKATKIAEFLLDADKTYQATIQLGSATDTGDKTGTVTASVSIPDFLNGQPGAASFLCHPGAASFLASPAAASFLCHPGAASFLASPAAASFSCHPGAAQQNPGSKALIETTLRAFMGEVEQIPPMYSAIKHQGKALYKLARKGREVERLSRKIRIYDLSLLEFNADSLSIQVSCSKGTYIRVLGEDIAKALGTLGHLSSLRRISSAGFEEHQMIGLDVLQNDSDLKAHLIPVELLLPDWQVFEISEVELEALLQGKKIRALHQDYCGNAKLICQDKIAAIAELKNGCIVSRKFL